MKLYCCVERCTEVLKSLFDRLILTVQLYEFASFNRLSLLREHLFDNLCNLSMTDVAASISGQFVSSHDHKVHEASKQAVQEEVQFVSVEFIGILEPKEEHYIY